MMVDTMAALSDVVAGTGDRKSTTYDLFRHIEMIDYTVDGIVEEDFAGVGE